MPLHLRRLTPRSFEFRQPAEWADHAATWAAWPFDDAEWHGQLEAARVEHAALVRAIARFEPVRLLVADEASESDARARLCGLALIDYLRVALDDVWLRDSGPIFVRRRQGEVSCVHWSFNAWGGKFDFALDDDVPERIADALGLDHFDVSCVLEGGSIDTNGEGVALTTRSCVLAPSRNPGLGVAEIEQVLSAFLGFDRVIWLDRGLEGDHTDGHIDTIARFVAPDTVVACTAGDDDPVNAHPLADNARVLKEAGLRVVALPLPSQPRRFQGVRLPLTYANFCLVNGAVIVPQYGDPHDARALDIMREVFATREVVGLSSSALITSGGSFHCLTQHQPAGPLWRAPHADPSEGGQDE